MSCDAVFQTILNDPLDSTLPLEDDLRKAIELDRARNRVRNARKPLIEPVLQEAVRRGLVTYSGHERRRHDDIEGRLCLLSLGTNVNSTYSLVIAKRKHEITHIAVNRLFPQFTDRKHPALTSLIQWNLITSVERKIQLYGFLRDCGFEPHRATFHIGRANWDQFTDEERTGAIALLRRAVNEYRAVSFDLPKGGKLVIFGRESQGGNSAGVASDSRALQQIYEDHPHHLRLPIIYQE